MKLTHKFAESCVYVPITQDVVFDPEWWSPTAAQASILTPFPSTELHHSGNLSSLWGLDRHVPPRPSAGAFTSAH
jgi:hypothetical protein